MIKINAQTSDVFQRAKEYETHILTAARKHNVDPHLLWTIAFLETKFQPNLVSSKGAKGLMQFMPGTAQKYGLKNPFNSIESIDAAARYVRDLKGLFGNRGDLILAGYNAGEGAVIKYNYKVPPYMETKDYVSRGKIIYEKISGIYSESKTIEKTGPPQTGATDKRDVNNESKTSSQNERSTSIYTQSDVKNKENGSSIIRKETKKVRSIYIN